MGGKDTSVIPRGPYCYVPDIDKNNSKAKDDTYYTKPCPYFTGIDINGAWVPWCSFLQEGGVHNNITDENFQKLEDHFGDSDEVYDKLPLDLLWDQVKECGENRDE